MVALWAGEWFLAPLIRLITAPHRPRHRAHRDECSTVVCTAVVSFHAARLKLTTAQAKHAEGVTTYTVFLQLERERNEDYLLRRRAWFSDLKASHSFASWVTEAAGIDRRSEESGEIMIVRSEEVCLELTWKGKATAPQPAHLLFLMCFYNCPFIST